MPLAGHPFELVSAADLVEYGEESRVRRVHLTAPSEGVFGGSGLMSRHGAYLAVDMGSV
jgi:hypothetical protein